MNDKKIICKYDIFGFCRYKDQCKYKHFTETCTKKECKNKKCEKRHPKKRRYDEKCRRQITCRYKHPNYEMISNYNKQKLVIDNLENELHIVNKCIYDLKVTLAQKDEEIETLKNHKITVNKIHEENQEEIKSVNNEIKQIMKQIKLKDSEIYRLNKEKSINIEENIKTKKENDKVKEINAKLIIKIANEEDNIRKLKQENQKLKEENDQFKKLYYCCRCDKPFISKTEKDEHTKLSKCRIVL